MVKKNWLFLAEVVLGLIAIVALTLALRYWYQHSYLTQMQWIMKQWYYLCTGVLAFVAAMAISFNR